MTLAKSDIETISTVFGKTYDEVSGAASSNEEVALGLKLNGQVLTDEKIKELKGKQDVGEKVGKEIAIKDFAKLASVELNDGEKKVEIVFKKLKEKINSELEEKYKNQTPTGELVEALQKAKEWEEKYNKLHETHDKQKEELQQSEEKYQNKVKEIEENNTISVFRSNLQSVKKITPEDAVIVARNIFKIEKDEEGKELMKRGNEIQRKADGTYETPENVLKSFIEEKQWIEGAGVNGSDQKNNPSEHPKGLSHDEAVKYVREKNMHEMETEGSKLYAEITEK